MKNQKGITLIALVITIVVLIILAGVAINMTLGENGIFNRAETAKLKYEIAQAKEELDLKIANLQAEKQGTAILQDLVDVLKNEEDMNYIVSLEEIASITGVDTIGDVDEIYVVYKIYQFRVDDTLETEFISIVDSEYDEDVEVEQITLNESNLTIFKGETSQLTATVTPSDATNKNIIWSSSDTSVATVENGTITAIGEGNATIIATSKSDNTIKASCEITVKDRVYLIKDGKALVDMAKTNISSVTENEGYITMETVNTGGRAVYYTTNTIDFSEYSKLNIDIELISKTSSTSRTQLYLGIFLNNTDEDFDKSLLIADDEFSSVERKTYTKNLESLNDNYKIAILKNATSPASKLKCNIYNLWLEK